MIYETLSEATMQFSASPHGCGFALYQALANAISAYVTQMMNRAWYMVEGVTTAGIVTSPFAGLFLHPMTPSFLMPFYRIELAFTTGTGAMIWETLFDQIGQHFKIVYSSWTTVPGIVATTIVPLNVDHFRSFGTSMYGTLQILPNDIITSVGGNGMKTIWDMFEEYLHVAIAMIPPAVVPIAGTVGILPFTGSGTITLTSLY